MAFDENATPRDKGLPPEKNPASFRAGRKPVVLNGRPLGMDGKTRLRVIGDEDLLDLRITLATTKSVEEFLAGL